MLLCTVGFSKQFYFVSCSLSLDRNMLRGGSEFRTVIGINTPLFCHLALPRKFVLTDTARKKSFLVMCDSLLPVLNVWATARKCEDGFFFFFLCPILSCGWVTTVMFGQRSPPPGKAHKVQKWKRGGKNIDLGRVSISLLLQRSHRSVLASEDNDTQGEKLSSPNLFSPFSYLIFRGDGGGDSPIFRNTARQE